VNKFEYKAVHTPLRFNKIWLEEDGQRRVAIYKRQRENEEYTPAPYLLPEIVKGALIGGIVGFVVSLLLGSIL